MREGDRHRSGRLFRSLSTRGASHAHHSGMILGADGCPAGWLCVALSDADAPKASVVPNFALLLERFQGAGCITIDIPIGLPDRGDRTCDAEARRFIKPRSSSVFPAPGRGVLRANGYQDALARSREIDGRGISKQAFNLIPKIAEVDAALRGDAELRKVVYEIHPEVSFRVWAGAPMAHYKKSAEGEGDRAALIEKEWPGALARCQQELAQVGGWADDDLIDAFASLWTARRIVEGKAIQLPAVAEVDGAGLPMRMMA